MDSCEPVQRLLGKATALRRSGQNEQALLVLGQALESHPTDVQLWLQRAAVYSALNQLDCAITDYRKAVEIDPRHHNALNNLAVLLAQQGRHEEAIPVYEAAIQAHSQVAYLHGNLGLSLKTLGRGRAAAVALEQAIALGAGSVDLRLDCAVAWSQAGEYARAVAQYDAVLAIQADHAKAHHNRGAALLELGQIDDAIAAEQRALSIQPDYALAATGLGNALTAARRYDEAVAAFDHALRLEPHMAPAHNNRANALRALQRDSEALAGYEQACVLAPLEEAYAKGLAFILSERGEHAQAQAVLERALQAMPGNAGLHFSQGLSLLASAQWAWGWFHFEWRYGTPEGFALPYKTQLPTWRPESAAKRLLVSTEWGLGDQIMFASMLTDLVQRQLDITAMVDPRLIGLLSVAFSQVRFVSRYDAQDDGQFDAHVSMASLGQFMRLQTEHFEAMAPGFLRADVARVTALRSEMLGDKRRLVGISWRTGRDGAGHRNIDLSTLVMALHQPDVVLVSLQYGDVADDLARAQEATGIEVRQCTSVDNKQDIDGLAALISVCDAVVSVDNTTVHLAGALGAATWALLPKPADWRWMHQGDRSPWYDSVHLCRQQQAGDWSGALAELHATLPR